MTANPAFLETRSGRLYFSDISSGASAPLLSDSEAIVERLRRLARDLTDAALNLRLTDQELSDRTTAKLCAAVVDLQAEAVKASAGASYADSLKVKHRFIRPFFLNTNLVEALIHLEVARQLIAMPASARAALVHKSQSEPRSTPRWPAVLTRLPAEVSALDLGARDAICDAATKVFVAEDWYLLGSEAEAASSAMHILFKATTFLREANTDVGQSGGLG